MSSKSRLTTAVLVALYPMLAGQAAHAQAAPESTRPAAATELEEIVVTAQKREERLIDVPISISAFTDSFLRDTGSRQLSDFLQTAPGVGIIDNGSGVQTIQIRGINSTYGDAPVGYYLDELPFSLIGNTQVPDVRTYDLQRVEVLRGPQGTLYGDGSIGGTIRILTHDPDLSAFHGGAVVIGGDTTGGNGTYAIKGMLNAPIKDDVAGLRFVASHEDFGGWIDNTSTGKLRENERVIDNYRGKFRWMPTDRLDMVFSAWHTEQDATGNSSSTKDGTFPYPADQTNTDYDLYSATIRYAFDAFDLVSATSQMDYHGKQLTYVAGLFAFTDDSQQDVLSQELRLTSKGDGMFRWTAGLFYRDMDRHTQAELPDFQYFQNLKLTSQSYAVFGEGTLSLLDHRLDLTLGVRYFSDDREYRENIDPTLLEIIQSIDPSYNGIVKTTSDDFSPRFNVSYKLTEDWMVYGNVAKGFRTGQPQPAISLGLAILNGVSVPTGVDPETLWSYEVGTKGMFDGGRLMLEAAAYYNDWKDLQVPVVVAQGVRALVNGGTARSEGIELSLTYLPIDALTLQLSAGYVDAKFTQDVAGINIQDGDKIPNVPETTVSASAAYRWPMMDGVNGFARIGAQYVSERTDTINLSLPSDSTTITDLRVGMEGRHLAGYIYVDNLTNENGAIEPYPDPPGLAGPTTRHRPRSYGIEVKADF